VSEHVEAASKRRSGAILVAPLDAAWPERASLFLTERGYAVARMNGLSLIGFLLASAGVAGVLVDSSVLDTEAAVACVRAMRRVQAQIAVIVVGSLTEHEMKRVAGAKVNATVACPLRTDELAEWFPDLRLVARLTQP
jgi:hypothetical protein